MKDISKLADEKIIEIVRSKDKEIYSEIIKRYENKLVRYATYLTGDADKAEEIVQNSFVKAYINIKGFNTRKKFSSWIYRIVHNEAMNVVKMNKRFVKLENLEFDSGVDLENDLIIKELKSDTRNCLKEMSIIYGEVLTLFFLEEKSYEEIGDILRISVGTVGARISRGKAIMRKICERNQNSVQV